MTEKQINARIQHKHDIEKNWNKATGFIPKKGEFIIYDAETSIDDLPEGRTHLIPYVRIKIGDGENYLLNLDFISTEKLDKNIIGSANEAYNLETELPKVIEKSKLHTLSGKTFDNQLSEVIYYEPINPEWTIEIDGETIYDFENLKFTKIKSENSTELTDLWSYQDEWNNIRYTLNPNYTLNLKPNTEVHKLTEEEDKEFLDSLRMEAEYGEEKYNYKSDRASLIAGDHIVANGMGSLATGQWNFVNGNFASSMGHSNAVRGKNALALGYGNITNGDNAVALNEGNKVLGYGSLGYGDHNSVLGTDSIIGGWQNTLKGNYSFVTGAKNIAEGEYIGGFGHQNTYKGMYNFGNGASNIIEGNYNNTNGYNNEIFGDYNTINGMQNNIQSTNNAVFGSSNKILQSSSSGNLINGTQNEIKPESSYRSIISGYQNIIMSGGGYNLAVGLNNKIYSRFGVALGEGLLTEGYSGAQVVTGRYNEKDTQAQFIVGNGTDTNNRKNVFKVIKDGRAVLGSDPQQKMDAVTKQYVDQEGLNLLNPIQIVSYHNGWESPVILGDEFGNVSIADYEGREESYYPNWPCRIAIEQFPLQKLCNNALEVGKDYTFTWALDQEDDISEFGEKYLWQYQELTFKKDNKKITTEKRAVGEYKEFNIQNISSITNYYWVTYDWSEPPPRSDSGWSTTVPSIDNSSSNSSVQLYSYAKINYYDGNVEYSQPERIYYSYSKVNYDNSQGVSVKTYYHKSPQNHLSQSKWTWDTALPATAYSLTYETYIPGRIELVYGGQIIGKNQQFTCTDELLNATLIIYPNIYMAQPDTGYAEKSQYCQPTTFSEVGIFSTNKLPFKFVPYGPMKIDAALDLKEDRKIYKSRSDETYYEHTLEEHIHYLEDKIRDLTTRLDEYIKIDTETADAPLAVAVDGKTLTVLNENGEECLLLTGDGSIIE